VSEEIGLFSNEHTIDRGRRLCEVNTYDDYQQIVRHYQSLQNASMQPIYGPHYCLNIPWHKGFIYYSFETCVVVLYQGYDTTADV